MQLVRSEMRVPSRHCQTLVPRQICDIFKRCSLHSQPTRNCMPQVMPVKVLELRFDYRVIQPVTPVFERITRFYRLKDAPFSVPPLNTVLSALIAASFNGTCNGSSFFVRGM